MPVAAAVPPPEITLVAPAVTARRGGVLFADFGQDVFGKFRLALPPDTPAGATLTVRLGEKLGPDGAIDRHPPGSVSFLQITVPVAAGASICEPPIPVHPHAAVPPPPGTGEITPFRYAEIEGAPASLDPGALRQLYVHAPFRRDAASFTCSDPTSISFPTWPATPTRRWAAARSTISWPIPPGRPSGVSTRSCSPPQTTRPPATRPWPRGTMTR